jgi:hypothetical protein
MLRWLLVISSKGICSTKKKLFVRFIYLLGHFVYAEQRAEDRIEVVEAHFDL